MKSITVLLAALVIVLGLNSLSRAEAPAGVQKWEVKRVTRTEVEQDATVLNKLGVEGWELVGLDGSLGWAFKRPLK